MTATASTVASLPERRPIGSLLLSIVLTEVVGASGALLGGPGGWYDSLVQPGLAPPNWVFGPVWTTLFALLGIAAWLVWRRAFETDDPEAAAETWGRARIALGLYAVHFVPNLAWTGTFFGLQRIGLALAVIAVLWVAIVAVMGAFYRVDRRAAALLVPYLAWVSFAAYLNYGFWTLN